MRRVVVWRSARRRTRNASAWRERGKSRTLRKPGNVSGSKKSDPVRSTNRGIRNRPLVERILHTFT